jgi:hypothetical protein
VSFVSIQGSVMINGILEFSVRDPEHATPVVRPISRPASWASSEKILSKTGPLRQSGGSLAAPLAPQSRTNREAMADVLTLFQYASTARNIIGDVVGR